MTEKSFVFDTVTIHACIFMHM